MYTDIVVRILFTDTFPGRGNWREHFKLRDLAEFKKSGYPVQHYHVTTCPQANYTTLYPTQNSHCDR
jgi:hypothetical protein